MSESAEYYDPVYHDEVDFTDSVVIHPISLRPSVMPSLLNRSNPENTILAAYDDIKLTELIQSSQDGRIIQLISLEQNSLIANLTNEGVDFLQRFSGQQIAFIIVIGQKSSGKSFFLDKILNLSNVQGNNFCIHDTKPEINVWSIPFVKQDLRVFIAQVSGCQMGSIQFNILFPYISLLSSAIINLQNFTQKVGKIDGTIQMLDKKFNEFLNAFYSEQKQQNECKRQVVENIFPCKILNIERKQTMNKPQQNQLNSVAIRLDTMFLPTAKNPQYRGYDQDLKIHSFLNKKCIDEKYIKKVSDIFKRVYSQISEKKHRQLVFNGGIVLKYIRHLSAFFNKAKSIDIGKIYFDVVKDLYISAYNYCVICYHESLQQSLSDEKPRSLDELIYIFEIASTQIIEKYNEFSLQKSLHEEYEEKLLTHIQSKERLILEINKKKTDLQMTKIYDDYLDVNNFNQFWNQANKINKKYQHFSHGRDQTMGRKLSEVIKRLKSGNNVDYRIMKQIQKTKQSIKTRNQQLTSIKQSNLSIKVEQDVKKRQADQKRASLNGLRTELDQKIQKIKKQLQVYQQNQNLNPIQLKTKQEECQIMVQKNDKQIQRLKKDQNEPVTNRKQVVDLNKRIQTTKNKAELLQSTLKQIQGAMKLQPNPQNQQTKMKIKKQNKVPQPEKKEGSANALKKSVPENKPMNNSSKVNKKAPK